MWFAKGKQTKRWGKSGEGEERERKGVKKINIVKVHVPTPYNECSHHVLQTQTIKKKKNDKNNKNLNRRNFKFNIIPTNDATHN